MVQAQLGLCCEAYTARQRRHKPPTPGAVVLRSIPSKKISGCSVTAQQTAEPSLPTSSESADWQELDFLTTILPDQVVPSAQLCKPVAQIELGSTVSCRRQPPTPEGTRKAHYKDLLLQGRYAFTGFRTVAFFQAVVIQGVPWQTAGKLPAVRARH